MTEDVHTREASKLILKDLCLCKVKPGKEYGTPGLRGFLHDTCVAGYISFILDSHLFCVY